MPKEVLITGGGVAACCCAALLSKAGYQVFVNPPARAGSPVLMLSDQTQLLLNDVFSNEGLFEGAVSIAKRVVLWGESGEAVCLPHSGLVMSEAVLLARLWPSLNIQAGNCAGANYWNVIASKQALPSASEHEFGSRVASTNSVRLSDGASSDACWVESTKSGWLFLLPCGDKRGSLISVGGSPEALIEESRLVAKQIAELGAPTGNFPAYPKIVTPLCGPGWIACGTAAIAFDPIAGEGAGNAMREGILAAAVIRAAGEGLPEKALLAHYSGRLLSGFLRHLKECCQYYAAGSSFWWQTELELTKHGVEWALAEMASIPAARFRLDGFELQSMG